MFHPFATDTDPGTDATAHIVALLDAATTDVNILVMSDSTASGGGALDRWPGLVAAGLGARYPAWTVVQQRIDTAAPYDTWSGAPYILQAGTGPRTLTLWNASVAGWCSAMLTGYGRWANLVTAPPADLIVLAHAHNEGAIVDLTETGAFNNSTNQGPDQFVSRMASFVGLLRQVHPAARVLVVATNAAYGTEESNQLRRGRLLADVASITGASYVDVAPAFRRWPAWESRLMLDQVHPNADGQRVYANEILRHFPPGGTDNATPTGLAASFVDVAAGANLLTNGDLVQTVPGTVDGWTAVNVTPSQNAVLYEGSKGYSTELRAAAAGTSYLTQVALTGNPLREVLGQWVTFAVRIRVPELGQTALTQPILSVGTASLNLVDYLTYSPHFQTMPVDGWTWRIVAARVPLTCTSITARIWCSIASNAAAMIQADRAVLVRGLLLRDGLR